MATKHSKIAVRKLAAGSSQPSLKAKEPILKSTVTQAVDGEAQLETESQGQHTHELLPLLYFIVELRFFFFFSFTSNILNGRGDIAHKYHKSTTYYFHWKLIFYIRYDWIG